MVKEKLSDLELATSISLRTIVRGSLRKMKDIATEINMSPSSLSKICAGQYYCSYTDVHLICKTLKIPIESFFESVERVQQDKELLNEYRRKTG